MTATYSVAPSPPGLVAALRPRQWAKNLLVLAPLLPAAGQLDLAAVQGALVAFLMFCAASSAIYLGNDVCDREADRAHPSKRNRAIAAGRVSAAQAVVTAGVLLAVAALLAVSRGPLLLLVLVVYVTVQTCYCLWLKHEPVLELASVTSGFLLRAVAGGVAAGIALSNWFLLSAAFGSLFVAAGKRYSEALQGERTGAAVRAVVARYTTSYLRFVWSLAATVVVATYAQWAFEVREATGSPWGLVSCVPFVLAVLRYAAVVDEGRGEAPEAVILADRVLVSLGVGWCTSLLLAATT
jgi:decaprenyl-phosphate phosphoribosyltransferase